MQLGEAKKSINRPDNKVLKRDINEDPMLRTEKRIIFFR